MARSEKSVDKARRRARQIRQIHALLSVDPGLVRQYIAEQISETPERTHYLLTHGQQHYACFHSEREHWFIGAGSPP